MDDRNAYNIAAWNAYKATASVSVKPRSQANQPHIPDWAKWFNPETVRPPPPLQVIWILGLFPLKGKESSKTRYLQQ